MGYEKYVKNVNGKTGKKDIFMYTLSTCIWCKKTKALLKDLGAQYSYIDVDLVEEDAKEEVLSDFSRYNPKLSYPTIVVNKGEKVIVGYMEDDIRSLSEDDR